MLIVKIFFPLVPRAPFFLGPIITHIPLQAWFFTPYLERYLYFLCLFVIWTVLVWQVMQAYVPKSGKTPRSHFPLVNIVTTLILTALVLLTLQFFREKFPRSMFYLLLGNTGLYALSKVWAKQGKFWLFLLVNFFYHSGIGYMSFLMTSLDWHWEPVLIATALAFMCVSVDLAKELLVAQTNSGKWGKVKILSRLYAGFVAAAPTLVGFLTYLGRLPKYYLLLFVCLGLGYQLILKCQALENKKKLSEESLVEAKALAALYIVILIGLGIVIL